MNRTPISRDEWILEAKRRFGPNSKNWKWICPVCNHVQSVADYKAANAPQSAIAFSCVGRWAGAKREAFGEGGGEEGPCNYAGAGLFAINPIPVVDDKGNTIKVFEFAPSEAIPNVDVVTLSKMILHQNAAEGKGGAS